MLRSFLAGAAVGACVDAWTMIPVPASSALPREYLLVTVVGTMLAAGVFALLLGLVLRLPALAAARARVQRRGAFLPGVLFGLMPILISYLPEALNLRIGGLPMGLSFVVWAAPAGLLALLALPLPKQLGPRGRVHGLLLAATVFVTLYSWTRPAAVDTDVVQAPAYPDPANLGEDGKLKEFLSPEQPPAPADAPDLVIVSIDTLRADLRREDRPVLPVLEELRAEAAWHAEGYSTSNQTVPGHIGMLAGLAPEQHRVAKTPHTMCGRFSRSFP